MFGLTHVDLEVKTNKSSWKNKTRTSLSLQFEYLIQMRGEGGARKAVRLSRPTMILPHSPVTGTLSGIHMKGVSLDRLC